MVRLLIAPAPLVLRGAAGGCWPSGSVRRGRAAGVRRGAGRGGRRVLRGGAGRGRVGGARRQLPRRDAERARRGTGAGVGSLWLHLREGGLGGLVLLRLGQVHPGVEVL